MTVKDLVLDHLAYTFEKESWQPPLSKAVEGLTAQQAAWKPAPERHSIWQIVRHIIQWKKSVLDAWDGNPPDYKEMEWADWQEVSGNQATWQADVGTLQALSQRVRERVQASDDRELSGMLATYKGLKDQNMAARLVRMATHDIYHAGQIRYIRALQGV